MTPSMVTTALMDHFHGRHELQVSASRRMKGRKSRGWREEVAQGNGHTNGGLPNLIMPLPPSRNLNASRTQSHLTTTTIHGSYKLFVLGTSTTWAEYIDMRSKDQHASGVEIDLAVRLLWLQTHLPPSLTFTY
ncbi:hypothetical protein SMMN14_06026 [Sphaerulina musiva]